MKTSFTCIATLKSPDNLNEVGEEKKNPSPLVPVVIDRPIKIYIIHRNPAIMPRSLRIKEHFR